MHWPNAKHWNVVRNFLRKKAVNPSTYYVKYHVTYSLYFYTD